MTELIIAAWSVSAVLIFLPVGRAARLARRRLGARISHVRGVQPRSAASLASTPAGPAGSVVPAESPGPGAAALHEEAPGAAAIAGETALPEEEPPVASEGAGEGTPASVAGRAAWALKPLRGPATLALYVVFIAGTIYLAPRLLVRVLNTDQPMAAITSQSMYPALKRGDLVLLQGVDKAADLRVGDIIAFESDDGFGIHRIVRIDGATITTKGDGNLSADDPITFDHVIGRAVTVRGRLAKIPYLGNIPLVFGRTSEEDAGQGESQPIFEGELDARGGASAPD